MALASQSPIGFEGYEKRLEIVFSEPPIFADPQGLGLRALTRPHLDEILAPAECTIVSNLSNPLLDSYVLSESSLFVYPQKIILKTCGTTKLLLSISPILKHAASLSLEPIFVKYSRGSFIFAGVQPVPHRSFTEEVSTLESFFGNMLKSEAYVIGDPKTPNQNWHVYTAMAQHTEGQPPVFTLEMCMTGLDRECASVFYKNNGSSASTMTKHSGISNILPEFEICDYEFDPCGYSMNGIKDSAFSTIHVTPEEGFSYASFEVAGLDTEKVNLGELVERVLRCFLPKDFTIVVHYSGGACWRGGAYSWGGALDAMPGYCCERVVDQGLNGEGKLAYQSFSLMDSCSPRSVFGCWGLDEGDFTSEEVRTIVNCGGCEGL
ncbi:hypothetical protein AMTRI_Chr03g50530 [Amborella trichopoda]|uniref:adenosylmethionine decarboxylase n=1 Tax=Amborella trichopoda TaxID=13333 RepID=W1NG83_AMBTC|nr:S-adenosylmethionine decarboxylase proenzyme [Amborella trichopoda]ERM94802.1 hypothetical protein AMTR_s00011p00266060 [Amborella trichopoda]|eukprot:XP_006878657.1 S-adenosylmethionine decarboxylase proenzyme [Amborella trichopoda]